MQKLIYLILAVVGFFAFNEFREKKNLKEQSKIVAASLASGAAGLESAGIPKNCVGKKYCVTVFVAPWCPACHHSEPTFRSLHTYLPTNRPDVGFGVVIGAASKEENASKQKELSPIETYADDSNSIMKLRQIKSFPTWVTTDATGTELHRQGGGYRVTQESQLPEVLKIVMGQ